MARRRGDPTWRYDPRRYLAFVGRRLRFASKFARQQLRGAPGAARPVFVVGAQRSGTNMLVELLDTSPDVLLYNEENRAAFREFRLLELEQIERLVARAPGRVVALKPICDTHRTDELLERFPDARALFIYRGYADAANSAVREFGEVRRDWIRWIVEGDYARLRWRGERLTPELVETMKRHYRPDLSLEEAAALTWYQRTQLFEQLGLASHARVLLVRYETLVQEPRPALERVYDFVGLGFEPSFANAVSDASLGKHAFPEIDPAIRSLCEGLEQTMGAHFARQWPV